MRYGFVLDQRKCIGCHACTVACKAENQVPVGSFRTWLKYVEKGEYPFTRRHFAVLRCNHCDNAPCVKICPTRALHTRPDGIVDLDRDLCIGCKSCMQACPYDALYIHPDHGVAEKCHYCAHRVERGLEPACVIVCPVQAIVPGDLDDPASPIAQLVALHPAQVRKPEQGTRPKVYYLGADQDAISLGVGNSDIPASYLWAEGPAEILQQLGRQECLPHTREVYNVAHGRPWRWPISAYLWTKSISAGLAMVGLFALIRDRSVALLSLIFLALTAALLVLDLKRPERFWRLLFRPNFTSWLVWGGYIITAFGLAMALWWLIPSTPVLVTCGILGAATAGYSAFLFGQAEGRDFWQSPLLLPHLIIQAWVAGCAVLLLMGYDFRGFLGGLILHLLMVAGEAAHGRRLMSRGLLAASIVLPILAIVFVQPIAALAGLYVYEHLWIQAGQKAPLS